MHPPLTAPLVFLLLSGCGEARAPGGGEQGSGRPSLPTVVLSDGQMPTPFDCGGTTCAERALDGFVCDAQTPRAEAVVVSGHSLPPLYLGGSAEALASAIACVGPSLVVLDTCYGFSTPLMEALVGAGVQARVVGSRRQVPGEGLRYGPAFLEAKGAAARGDAVRRGDEALESWTVNADELTLTLGLVEAMSPEALTQNLQRVHPNLVNAPLGGAIVLVPVVAERFRRAPTLTNVEAHDDGAP
ncbi:hypothetical protein L6R49_23500 [Myxococcota bacterium]|nr:hypothetical protein [Myxococcota bacterium]